MTRSSTIAFACILALAACTTPRPYGGTGGMTAHEIKPDVYLHHYARGFTGVDAMGWDANLQFAWSRLGAAKTCGVAFDGPAMTQRLVARWGHDRFVHELNGVDFHHLQSRGIPGFCTPERVAEIKALLPAMAAGEFVQRS